MRLEQPRVTTASTEIYSHKPFIIKPTPAPKSTRQPSSASNWLHLSPHTPNRDALLPYKTRCPRPDLELRRLPGDSAGPLALTAFTPLYIPRPLPSKRSFLLLLFFSSSLCLLA
ncbi:hypothetical protein CCMA1212_009188 [Trichoderma ghanense]|uniref:Uncharacterized protein n=1 Tax=Trichoderma ghanense TaxID=65468 RepID=A0ABY2GT11_9HYPO